jgi:hypothetical protein
LKETQDLQQLIVRHPKLFFDEIGLNGAIFLGSEVRPAERIVKNRIDILAIDEDGTLIVIELKRGSDKLQLLQAIAYAAMIRSWEYEDLVGSFPDNADLRSIKLNGDQRVVLVADEFEYEVLIVCEWLTEKYGVDIICVRLRVTNDTTTQTEYLSGERVYPPLEIEDQIRQRKRGASALSTTPEEVITTASNNDLASFDQAQNNSSIQNSSSVRYDDKNKTFKYVVNKRIEWVVGIKKNYASVWQYRRFAGDLDFWRQRLSSPESVGERETNRALAFRLLSKMDFQNFLDAVGKAGGFEWSSTPRGG